MQSFIALGGNLGAVEETFRSALGDLKESAGVRVKRVSSFYHTLPMGEGSAANYLNAAAELSVQLSPLELLDLLQALEARHGRTRELHWGPRTLDLDILLYEQIVLDHPRLLLPHPGCWYRRFVLDPLAEIAADVLHPIKRLTIAELRERLLERPLSVGLAGGSLEERTKLARELSASFPNARVKPWTPDEPILPALLLWLGTPGEGNLTFGDLPPSPRLDLTRFPDPPRTSASHALSAALG